MTRFLATICFLYISILLHGQNKNNLSGPDAESKLTEGATLLFKNIKSNLTATEKNSLFQKLQIKLSADKKSFVVDDIPVGVFVFPTDMNKDGKEEVFIGFESVALFGDRQSFSLYIKNNTGAYQQQPEIGGGRPTILSTINLGYPDVLVGGPGFEFPVYRWNGNKYALYKKMKDDALNNNNSTDIEVYSKSFTNSIKR